ncbi:serine hydrolase domain-containing protein [Bacillus sp. FJAT-28004]|uniref:serine hydrolase domain-containing protein n=1 Tax=Bacillus sp. FJAT-28004 TaxID=1679165 RepID=UPI0006B5916F|nr:serine hydrolase [Bacillus sp. FJAT-28004]
MSFEWHLSTPEAEGMDVNLLEQIDDYVKQKRYRLINSVIIVKNGKLVYERYFNKCNENTRHSIKSVWKSILAIAIGICLDKGLIGNLDEQIGKYLPSFAGHNHHYHKLITIRHLLTMSSGIYWNGGVHYHCPMLQQMMRTQDWMTHIADIDMHSVPGMTFQYKEWDVMLLSAIIGKAYGGTSYDLIHNEMYKPLDIASGIWPSSPCGFSYTVMKGEEQSDLSARDMAKVGLLFLGDGRVNGKQIVSSEFVKQAITPSNPSYGFLWWLSPNGYGCRGFGGQEVNVIPKHQFVSVIQATPTASSKSYPDIHEMFLSKAIK